MDTPEHTAIGNGAAPRGSDRRHQSPARRQRVNLRLDDHEHHEVTIAAARAGLTTAGFCATAALAAARESTAPGQPISGVGITRTELAALQRDLFAARTAITRTGTNQAVAALNTTSNAPAWLGHAAHRCQRPSTNSTPSWPTSIGGCADPRHPPPRPQHPRPTELPVRRWETRRTPQLPSDRRLDRAGPTAHVWVIAAIPSAPISPR